MYYTKVKSIYGEIIKYASTAQSTLDLTNGQNNAISQIKIANRKMVEIIKYARELNKNIGVALNDDNPHLRKEYNFYRKQLIRVLRTIHLFRTEAEYEIYARKLKQLKMKAKANLKTR